MTNSDREVIKKMSDAFNKALKDLRTQHVKEVQDLRSLYIEAKKQVAELERKNGNG